MNNFSGIFLDLTGASGQTQAPAAPIGPSVKAPALPQQQQQPATPAASAAPAPAAAPSAPPAPVDGSNLFHGQANPFDGYFGDLSKNAVGAQGPKIPESNFQFLQDSQTASDAAKKSADWTSSFFPTLGRTVAGLPGSLWDISKSIADHPIDTLQTAVHGMMNGVTLGGLDWVLKKAYVSQAEKAGITPEQAQQIAEQVLYPDADTNPTLKGIAGGFDFGGTVAPWSLAENLATKGVRYAAPIWAANWGRAAKFLSNAGAWGAIGQVQESFLPKDQQNRVQRLLTDVGTAGLFEGAGMAFRGITKTAFANPFSLNPAGDGVERLLPATETASEDALREAAVNRISELKGKEKLTPPEKNVLSYLEKNKENTDALAKFQKSGMSNPGLAEARGPANVAMKANLNPEPGKPESGTPVNLITDNPEALKDYIKGSGSIDYKLVDNLGKDALGNDVNARHEFDPETMTHTIYATDQTTAEELAHELGHVTDQQATKATTGLSELLPDFNKNRGAIEDALGSYALSRLGGEATHEEISAEVKKIADAIQKEASDMSELRRGVAATSAKERFADARAMIATSKGASEKAPVISGLIDHLDRFKQGGLFEGKPEKIAGDKFLNPNARIATRDAVVKEMGEPNPTSAQVENYAKGRGYDAIDLRKEGKGTVKILNDKATMTKGEIEANGMKKMPKVEGQKPETAPIRAEKTTKDAEIETLINTKVLPKLTGEFRGSLTDEQIRMSALGKKMDEKTVDQTLAETLGKTKEAQAVKQYFVDNATGLHDLLQGRSIENLSGEELKSAMAMYARLIHVGDALSGIRTEASNLLRSFNVDAIAGDNDTFRRVLNTVQKLMGDETDPFKLAEKAMNSRSSGVVSKYFELWYPSILSGPKTTVRNLTGNFSNMAMQHMSMLFTSSGRQELMPRMFALVGGLKKALSTAGEVLRGEAGEVSKFYEAPAMKEQTFKGGLAFLNKVEYVGRFLNAQDAFASSLWKDSEIAGQRAGKFSYGLADQATQDAVEKSFATWAGKMGTFRNEMEGTVVGSLGKAAQNLRNSENNFIRAGSQWLVPFVKTISNIMDRRVDFVPVLNTWRTFGKQAAKLAEERSAKIVKDADLYSMVYKQATETMDGKAAKEFATSEVERVSGIIQERIRNQQMGRFFMGTSVMAAGVPLAMTGHITGSGPKGANARNALMESGWRPNSIILPNGVALPYQNLALPLATIFSVLGNIHDSVKYGPSKEGIAARLSDAVGNMFQTEIDQSFLSGINSVFKWINGDTSPAQFFSGTLANMTPIPAAWTQVKDMAFPARFETNTVGEALLNKIGITSGLQPKLDSFGEQQQADLIYGLTPPLMNAKINDPVVNFMTDKGVGLGKPSKTTTVKGTGSNKRQLTPEEYTQYVKEAGQATYQKLSNLIQSGHFDRFKTKEEIQAEINKISDQEKAHAKSKIRF